MDDNKIEHMIATAKSAVLILAALLISLFIHSAAPAYPETTTSTPRQVVEYVLTLEKIEADFYQRAIDATENGALGNLPQAVKEAIIAFAQDDANHIEQLSAVLTNLGGNPDTVNITDNPNYNAILAHNPFAKSQDLLLAGQYIEDLGAAAYEGQLQNLLAAGVAAKPVLAGVLAIHSVEARHAAGIRYLRQTLLGDNVRPWIRDSHEVIYKQNRVGSPMPLKSGAFDGYATQDEVLPLEVSIVGTNQQASNKNSKPTVVQALW